MLETLRKSVSGWVAKLFIGLLVVSFAVWGIADIFGGYGARALATVGDTEISDEEFRYTFQQEMQRVGRQFGRSLTLDQARALGLDQQVLGRLLTNATLDNAAKTLNVSITDEVIAKGILDNPAFRNPGGDFDRGYFEQVLRSNGLTEAGFVQEQKRAHTRQQVSDSIAGAAPAPKVLLDALHRFQDETRTIAYITLKASATGEIAQPDEQTLREYYNSNKAEFRAPEYRRVEIIALDPPQVARTIDIPDEEIRAEYDRRKGQLGKPERREVQQVMFPSKAEAEAAAKRIEDGASLLDVAKDRGLSERDVSLGLVARSAIVDEAVREAAFSLEEGKVSAPVAGSLGTALVRVTRIEPGTTMTYEEARDQLRQELAQGRAVDRLLDLHDQIEDERAAGSNFAEIARKLGVPLSVIEAIDNTGKRPDGTQIEDLPGGMRTVRTIFGTDPGVEIDPLETGDSGYAWINVAGVTPGRERAFEEVRSQVEASWREEQVRTRLTERTNELLERLNSGEPLEAVAAGIGAEVRAAGPLKRSDSHDDLSRAAIQTAFATPVDGHAASLHEDGRSRLLMLVRASELAPLASGTDEARALRESLGDSLANSLLAQYIAAKQADYGVSINQQTLRALLGER